MSLGTCCGPSRWSWKSMLLFQLYNIKNRLTSTSKFLPILCFCNWSYNGNLSVCCYFVYIIKILFGCFSSSSLLGAFFRTSRKSQLPCHWGPSTFYNHVSVYWHTWFEGNFFLSGGIQNSYFYSRQRSHCHRGDDLCISGRRTRCNHNAPCFCLPPRVHDGTSKINFFREHENQFLMDW